MSYISQKTGLQVDALLDKIDALGEATSSQSGLMSSSDKMKLDDMEGVSASEKATWNAKQDAIADLAAIRSGASAGSSAYQKPSGGIPKGDLASAVQASLGKADTALQSFTETDPTVPSWAKASNKPSYTATEVGAVPISRTVNGKALNADITLSASDVSALPSSTVIPAAPGTLNTDNSTAQTVNSSEALSGTVKLHKVSKTGSYNDLLNTPTIPAAQIQSDWNQSTTTALDYIKNKPTIPTVPTNVSAFNNDAGYLTSHQDISGKEDKFTVETVASGTTSLLVEIGTYYSIAGTMGTLAITLPAVTDTSHLSSIVFFLTTGTTPALSLASAGSSPIYYTDNYSIEADSTYEINALFNGTAWVVAAIKINVA